MTPELKEKLRKSHKAYKPPLDEEVARRRRVVEMTRNLCEEVTESLNSKSALRLIDKR
jgi:hypothetical protein